MNTLTGTSLSYPIGKFVQPNPPTAAQLQEQIAQIAALPAALVTAVHGLSAEQLNTPYRPSGWTVCQVIHHLPDSHMNAYIRMRLALTEQEPTIKPYDEQAWALLPDAAAAPIHFSLQLLEALHERWTLLLFALEPEQLTRTYLHPENGLTRLDHAIGMYAWHGRHHLAHITSLKERMGW